MTFEEFMATTTLPAECDDERVLVGMRMAFNAGQEMFKSAGIMKTFHDWFDTYERDGGELMLYNSIDLQAAWDAAWDECSHRPAAQTP